MICEPENWEILCQITLSNFCWYLSCSSTSHEMKMVPFAYSQPCHYGLFGWKMEHVCFNMYSFSKSWNQECLAFHRHWRKGKQDVLAFAAAVGAPVLGIYLWFFSLVTGSWTCCCLHIVWSSYRQASHSWILIQNGLMNLAPELML